jgi:hypothetical protein
MAGPCTRARSGGGDAEGTTACGGRATTSEVTWQRREPVRSSAHPASQRADTRALPRPARAYVQCKLMGASQRGPWLSAATHGSRRAPRGARRGLPTTSRALPLPVRAPARLPPQPCVHTIPHARNHAKRGRGGGASVHLCGGRQAHEPDHEKERCSQPHLLVPFYHRIHGPRTGTQGVLRCSQRSVTP